MPRIALGQSDEDTYTGAEAWVEPTAIPVTSQPTLFAAAGGVPADVVAAATTPDIIKTVLNKYLFGSTAPIPTATQYTAPTSTQWIAGVPNMYLLLGGLGVALLAMGGGKKRR